MQEQKNISLFSYSKTFTSQQILKISQFLKNPTLDIKQERYYINIDLSYEELLNNSEAIVKNIFYKLYFYKKNYFVFTCLSLTKLIELPKLSQFLHIDHSIIRKYLYLEQLINLIKISSTMIDYSNKNLIENLVKIPNKLELDLPLEKLNSHQLEAVKLIEGPNLLLAPAGSGKTKTLINRIAYLINQGINPENILVLAFNKKVEKELINRLETQFKIQTNIKTFHAFGNQIIRKYLNYDFEMNGLDQQNDKLIKTFIKTNSEQYKTIFSQIKNNLLTRKELDNQNTWKLFQQYLTVCQQEKFYNFDDMIYLALKIILDDCQIRKEIQQKYQYILIDEFQDLNQAQLLLVDIIAKPQDNLFVVGDDDQMIYRFRGATEDIILNYKNRYSVCNQNILQINYRSPKNIIYHANQVISYNNNRIKKDIKAFQTKDGQLDLIIQKNMYQEAMSIVNYIKENKTSANTYNDFAILYRYNQYGDYLKLCLEINDIPVQNMEDKIINTQLGRLIFNYLQLVLEPNPASKVIQNCLFNFDKQLPYSFLRKIINLDLLFNQKFLKENLTEDQLESCYDFVEKIKAIKLNSKVDLTTLIKMFELDKIKEEKSNENELSNKETLKIITEMGKVLPTITEVYQYFIKCSTKENNQGVLLSTIHKTKGKEFKNVIYYHVVTVNNILIEDERRLFYVAVTRAKEKLLLTTIDNETSIFIKEYFLDKEFEKYNEIDLKLELLRTENQKQILKNNLKKVLIQDLKNTSENNQQLLFKYYDQTEMKINQRISKIKKELNYRTQLV